MVALDPSSISYPSVEHSSERKFTSVVSLSKKNIDAVLKTIECWKDSLSFIERSLTSISDSPLAVAEDCTLIENYHLLLRNIEETAGWIIKDLTYPIQLLLSFDSSGEIQSMASYSFTDSSKEVLEMDAYSRYNMPELAVCRVITAPFNVRWKTSFSAFPRPMRGGGTLLIHALFQLAKINKNSKIWLKAIKSAVPFYTNLRMSRLEGDYFELVLSDEAKCHEFTKAYQKIFGDSFNYSLLLTGRVTRRVFSANLAIE